MNLVELLKIALQALKINKTRSALTMLGVIIGVTSVILLVSIGSGLRTYITTELESRERWILSGLSTKGKLYVDSGAAVALGKQNRSLLAAGIRKVEGAFQRGDIVAIYDSKGTHLGCGITNYSSGDIDIIKGSRSNKIAGLLNFDYGPEVVHRNNLVVLWKGRF